MSPAVGGRRDDAARDAIENAATYADDAGVRVAEWERHAQQDRLAATDQLPAVGDLPDAILPNPDCTAGKHHVCPGDSWDTVDDLPADCPCPCHDPGGWGER